jgi:hypothetical protein
MRSPCGCHLGPMQASELAGLEKRLEAFLGELTLPLGRRDRRAWAGAYLRGLLLDGEL